MGSHTRRWRSLALAALVAAASASLVAQAPRAPQPPPTPPTTAAPDTPPPATAKPPSEAQLGVTLYPNAVFLRSYDAGRGQHYHLFGVAAPFADMVNYYRNLLKDRGNLVFEVPPTHVFEIGRFREETMAFPPSVTIKDYTFGGSAGYPNPVPGARPERFPTVLQIVGPPPGTPPGDR
jgi:hypothetical protein